LGKLEAVKAGFRPAFPLVAHVHAVVMGAWMVLLLVQTWLMATKRPRFHKQLGLFAVILAPVMVITAFMLVPINSRVLLEFAASAPPEFSSRYEGSFVFIRDVGLMQIRTGFTFSIFIILGLLARKRDSELHKRMMLIATSVTLSAATDRIPFLFSTMPSHPFTLDLWQAAVLAPMFLWDVRRQGRVHRAYWIFLVVSVLAAIPMYLLWGTEWWQRVAPSILYE